MQAGEILRRAFTSFLAIPTGVIATFVLLAIGTYVFERSEIGWFGPIRSYMQAHVFGDAEATSGLLGTIATGIITMTSITFSLLLLALQQSAGSMTHQVFDQFLRRRLNQVYFGFFIGVTLYSLITLATVSPPFNPVFGASLTLLFVTMALYILLLLIYSTISQMRPTEIIRSIHDHTLAARQRQLPMIERTRRSPALPAAPAVSVPAPGEGFVVGYDLDAMAKAIGRAPEPVEIVLLLPIGSYVAFHDPVAEVRGGAGAEGVARTVANAIQIDQVRALDNDPAYGIEQIETIAWRSISTSQQNPSPGLVAIRNLRDILARWIAGKDDREETATIAVVYPDNAMSRLLAALESLAVVASEAMQHQVYAEIVRTVTLTFERLPPEPRRRAEELILRGLAGLGDHMLTMELDDALITLARVLEQSRCVDTAAAVRAAHAGLATSIGKLNSRSTRVPGAG
ncbi:MAG: DUF2254 domain-containing protein [Chloroflexota bacterium]|nr:DUF2254 domain-containing protein [Chloroflexota bacterium]